MQYESEGLHNFCWTNTCVILLHHSYTSCSINCWSIVSSEKMIVFRSRHRMCSGRKCVLRKFRKIHGKTPVPEYPEYLFLLKKRLWHSCFPVNFVKFLRTLFSENTSGRLLLCLWSNSRKIMPLNMPQIMGTCNVRKMKDSFTNHAFK